jgi:hypothetical protein
VNHYRSLFLLMMLTATAMAVGCEAPGVGDPCTPEVIPQNGFNETEAYLETSSVQCRTRVCIVYKIEGFPHGSDECGTTDSTCASAAQSEERIFCSCRCGTPVGVDGRTCECPDGFRCEEVLDIGPDGTRGSYCVRDSIPMETEGS